MPDVNLALTAAGQALRAKIELGDGTIPLEITRIATASGTSLDPLNMTALINEQQEFDITNRVTMGPRTSITAILTNYGNPSAGIPPLAAGYALSQIGFYALDPDLGEILYRISQFDSPNYVPAASERGWTFEPTFNFITGNASEVIVQIDPSGFTTMQNIWDSVEYSLFPEPQASVKTHYRETKDASQYTPSIMTSMYKGAKITEIVVYENPGDPSTNGAQIALPVTLFEAVINQATGRSLAEVLEISNDGELGLVKAIKDHISESIFSENGAHNIRFHGGKLQGWDGMEWVDIATGGGGSSGNAVLGTAYLGAAYLGANQ